MPAVTFTDQENVAPSELIPAGDYTFEVIKAEACIRSGGKTNGCEAFDFQIRIEQHPGCTIWEDLVFGYDKTQFRIDTFLKSTDFRLAHGNPPAKGEGFDLTTDDIMGLRGWCTVKVEEYTANNGEKRKTNRVAVWLTNKPKLPRNVPKSAESQFGF